MTIQAPQAFAARPTHRVRIGGYRPGLLAAMVTLQVDTLPAEQRAHARTEARIAADIASFIHGFEPMCDLLMGAFVDDTPVGAIAVDGRLHGTGAAALRWFSLAKDLDRAAIGRVLLDHALDFCRERGFATVTLFHPAVEPDLELLFKQAGFRRQDPGAMVEAAGSILTLALNRAAAAAVVPLERAA